MKNILIILFAFTVMQASTQVNNLKEILSIKITGVQESSTVNCDTTRSAGFIAFGGYCDNSFFKGEILPGGFDSIKKENGITTLSARYMLVGTDSKGDSCSVFIENNAIQGAIYTRPKIFTDSKTLDFLNTSELIGHLDMSNNQFYVRIYIQEQETRTEDVRIKGSYTTLAATIEKPELKQNEKCPMVIICHGFGGYRNDEMIRNIAGQLSNIGIASIRFDFNGHGESDGRFEDMTVLNEIEDAKSIYRYAASLPFVDTKDIAILGISQGGVVAGMTAGELGHNKLAAAVLMCPAAVQIGRAHV